MGDATRRMMGNRGSVGRDARDAGNAGVGRKSAIDTEQTHMRVLVTVSGSACIVEARWIDCGGWTRKKVSIEFTEIRATNSLLHTAQPDTSDFPTVSSDRVL